MQVGFYLIFEAQVVTTSGYYDWHLNNIRIVLSGENDHFLLQYFQ